MSLSIAQQYMSQVSIGQQPMLSCGNMSSNKLECKSPATLRLSEGQFIELIHKLSTSWDFTKGTIGNWFEIKFDAKLLPRTELGGSFGGSYYVEFSSELELVTFKLTYL